MDQRATAAGRRAIALWGIENQLRQLQEECCELGAAINHYQCGRITSEQLAAEVADVCICLVQADLLLPDLVSKALAAKLERLEARLDEAGI